MPDPEDRSLLSQHAIPRAERLIFALDVPDRDAARRLVDRLGESVAFYKVGLELAMTEDYFPLVDELRKRGKQVFCDLKLHDVEETVARAVRRLRGRDGIFVTVHGYDASVKPYKQNAEQARKLLAEAGYPNGLEVGFLRTQPIVEPGLIQTSDALVADLAKVGIRTKARMVGEVGPFTNLVRDSKADPMFEWSWGYASVFDADAILYDVMTCNQPYSYYCNAALDDLVMQGRSTLDSKKRTEIYARVQKLIHEDAAYLYKWGLRGVWGISNRIEYEAPRDEIDRMFVVTARRK